jgi:hypothetical protein
VENNKLLAELTPLSKDLSAMGDAGIKLLEYLAPAPAPVAAAGKPKKLSGKARKAELEAEKAAQAAKQDWLARQNTELARLAQPPRRAAGGADPGPQADVRLAAYRPVKVLADALGQTQK